MCYVINTPLQTACSKCKSIGSELRDAIVSEVKLGFGLQRKLKKKINPIVTEGEKRERSAH